MRLFHIIRESHLYKFCCGKKNSSASGGPRKTLEPHLPLMDTLTLPLAPNPHPQGSQIMIIDRCCRSSHDYCSLDWFALTLSVTSAAAVLTLDGYQIGDSQRRLPSLPAVHCTLGSARPIHSGLGSARHIHSDLGSARPIHSGLGSTRPIHPGEL